MSAALFARAERVLPGGVNSPVRAFGSVGGVPPFLARGEGARVWDEDGAEYIDLVCGWGPLLFGHAAPCVVDAVRAAAGRGVLFGTPTSLEVEYAEAFLALVGWPEQIRLTNSGTEASATAVRLARAATGRTEVLRFHGSYHGHVDLGATVSSPYNDLDAAAMCLARRSSKIAAVIVEPVAANIGVVVPEPGFLEGLRALCTRFGALLLFDEVVTGFRIHQAGAAGRFGVTPDLAIYGKIIGGGLPVGLVAGPRALMTQLAPAGPVFHGGTFAGNPVTVSAGLAHLREIARDPGLYARLDGLGLQLETGVAAELARGGFPGRVARVGSMWTLFLRDTSTFARFFHAMLRRGVHLAASQHEANFISTAHTAADIEAVVSALRAALREAHAGS